MSGLSCVTASIGVVPQHTDEMAAMTLRHEVCSRRTSVFAERFARWQTSVGAMTFASLAHVTMIATPSLAAAPARDAGDEVELHAAIVRGDAAWQRRAFDAFHGLVHGLLLRTLGPSAEIADLVGDAFVMFFENAKRIQRASAVRSYLISITMNLARREIRMRKRRRLFQRFTGSVAQYEQEAGSDDPKAKAALLELMRILDELSAEERAVFVLSTLEGM